MFAPATNVIKALLGPKYDGENLHKVVRETLKETRLHETLTNIVVPTFDIKYLQPMIFSSYQVLYLYICHQVTRFYSNSEMLTLKSRG